jgi:hypothetical protein
MFLGNCVVLGKLSLREDAGVETEGEVSLGDDNSLRGGNGLGGGGLENGRAGGTAVGAEVGGEMDSLGEDMGVGVGFGTGDWSSTT